MRVRIGCIDGHTYVSDHTPDDKVIDEWQGQDFLPNIAFNDIDEVVGFVNDFIGGRVDGKDTSVNHISLKVDNVARRFKQEHVVWWEVSKDV